MSSLKGPRNDNLRKAEARRVFRSVFRRATLLGVVLTLWLGIPYAMLSLRLTFFLGNFIVWLWLFSTMNPALPGTGLVAAVVGGFSRDRLVSFLVGFLPALVLLFLDLTGPLYGDFGLAGTSLSRGLTLLTIGLGFGLMGIGGALYGEWESEPESARQVTLRLAVLCATLGFFLWLGAAWGSQLFNSALQD